MSAWMPLIGLAAVVSVALRGLHMLAHPARYLGPGRFDARDPRTVRFFGSVLLIIGTAVAVVFLVKIAGAWSA